MIKKVWVTNWARDLFSFTMESSSPDIDWMRIKFREYIFPANPTPEQPLRHTVASSIFSIEDINKIAQCLDEYRTDK